MKKKMLIFGMSLMSIVLFAGCSSLGKSGKDGDKIKVEEKGMPIVKEPLKMTMMAPRAGDAEWKDMPTLQEFEKITGISFEYKTPPQSDFATKLNLAFASEDLPDIIFEAGSDLSGTMQLTYGTQGMLIPLEDLIDEYAPNLKKVLDSDPSFRKSITAPDGHIYSLPRLFPEGESSPLYMSPLWYNGDWLEKLNVKEIPKTTDELYDLLVRFKNEDPSGTGKPIPLSSDYKMLILRTWLLPSFGLKTWGIDQWEGKVRFTPATDNYLEYLTYMNKLYSEGLLDKEVFSQSSDVYTAKTRDNRVGVFAGYNSYGQTGKKPDDALGDPMFMPLTSDIQKKPLVPGHPRIVSGLFAITSNCKSPEAAMRWADYLYTKEGADLLRFGPEGSWWKYDKAADGSEVRVYTGTDVAKMEEDRGKISPDYGIVIPGIEVDAKEPIVLQDITQTELAKFDKFRIDEIESKYMPYGEVPFPVLILTNEEVDEIKPITTDLNMYIEEMEAKFITGVEPLSNWPKYIETLEQMNLKRYVEVYQQAYDRWDKQ